MKTILGGTLLVLGLLLASCGGNDAANGDARTSGTESQAMDANDPNVVKVSVPTVQCESCAHTITEGLKKVDGTGDVNVDLNSKTVFVKVANNSPEMQTQIERAIAGVGYSTPSTPRDSVAYANLPACCQEGGMEKFKAK